MRLQEQPAHFFLFDSFGKNGFKEYVISDDEDIISQIITNYDEITQLGFRYFSFHFNAKRYLDIMHSNEFAQLSDTAKGVFNFFLAFAAAFDLNSIKITSIANQLQSDMTGTCGAFALYFLYNVFFTDNIFLCEQPECTFQLFFKACLMYLFGCFI